MFKRCTVATAAVLLGLLLAAAPLQAGQQDEKARAERAEVLKTIVKGLDDPDKQVRSAVWTALTNAPAEELAPLLTPRLRLRDEEKSTEAFEFLLSKPHADTYRALMAFADERKGDVRLTFAAALASHFSEHGYQFGMSAGGRFGGGQFGFGGGGGGVSITGHRDPPVVEPLREDAKRFFTRLGQEKDPRDRAQGIAGLAAMFLGGAPPPPPESWIRRHSGELKSLLQPAPAQAEPAPFFGVGLILRIDGESGAMVVDALHPQAGEDVKAAVKAGDVLTHVDGTSTSGKQLEEVIKLVRGAEGTTVRLTFKRSGQAEPLQATLKRKAIREQE